MYIYIYIVASLCNFVTIALASVVAIHRRLRRFHMHRMQKPLLFELKAS